MRYLLYLLVLVSLITACRKDQQGDTFCFDGRIEWAGDPAADGFGWVIFKDDSITTPPYIPRNLPDSLKIDQLKVAVCVYETNDEFMCECARPMKKYHIESIRRR